MLVLEIILWIVGVYLACGIAFSLPFVLKGIQRIDEGAKGTSWGFKLIVIPGTAVFWPLLLRRWMQEEKKKPKLDSAIMTDTAGVNQT